MSDEKPEVIIKKQVGGESELQRLELELKQLEVLEKKANLQDVQERLQERELKRENKRQTSITNGHTLKQLANNDEAAQLRCNHKKGGNGAQGVVGGQGDDSQYAVLKHTFCNGDTWVRCLRCGKTWKPPITSDYTTPVQLEVLAKLTADYQAALHFMTRNVTSSALMYKFSDGGQFFREQMRNTTLR